MRCAGQLLQFCLERLWGALGGLLGLGGAEFRLPLLILFFELYAHRAIRINRLISLVTLCFALVTRLRFVDAAAVSTYQSEITAMIVSGVLAAWLGAGVLSRVPKNRVSAILAALLIAISALLLVETAFQGTTVLQLPESHFVRIVAGLVAGLGIGAVSSLLGVAGGEIIIPVMIFLFGADIKTAGTASLLIAIPTVTTGVLRHWLHGRFRSRTMLLLLAAPMSLGSAVGAVMGGALASVAPANGLRVIIAAILAASA